MSHYDALGLDSNATPDEIKKAYRRLARELHPDVNPSADAAERFKGVTHAYEVLSDPEQRARYDRGGSSEFGLGDIFESFFGSPQRGPRSRAQRGQDALLRVDLDLYEAAFGSKQTLTIDTAILCSECKGSCTRPGTTIQVCQICRGSGQIQRQVQSFMGTMVTTSPCSACRGTGEVIPDPCGNCRGQGRVRARRDLDLDIPAGVSDGMRLHLAGEGEIGFAGGPAGDLYLEVSVRPHLTFGRDGDNLTASLQVGVADAALGFEIEIEALDGPAELSVKPGAQSGDRITIRDRGAHKLRGRGRGDLVIELRVATPDKLDSKQKELFAKLRALRKDSPHLIQQRPNRGRF